jgi:hypothetical protein
VLYHLFFAMLIEFFGRFSCPHAWYPVARRKNRKIFLHVGPTNSGKTYHALKQLESSPSGIIFIMIYFKFNHRIHLRNIKTEVHQLYIQIIFVLVLLLGRCLLWSFEIACMGGGKKVEQGKCSL